jgi:two-component system sensor histidine kinase TctE
LFAERGFSGTVTTVVGHTTIAREALAWDIARQAWVVLGLAGIGMAALAAFSIRSALQPLRRIERDLLGRDPKDLTPLEIAVPPELRAVVEAINRFMLRLHRQIDGMQNLISDSAHQLRTPIAALRAQADLAAEEQDPARQAEIVQRIHARSVGLSRLTDQMLNRALVIHRADTAIHTVVDLRRVAMTASEVFDDGTLFESGRLRLSLPQAPAMVKGDLLSLEEAAKNLISNALQHGKGTVTVTVTVTLADGVARLSVHDEGCGVSNADAQRFGERFRRGNDHRTHGTGIGLSIAHAVASAHQTAIETTADGHGFEIGFGLPTAAAAGGR